MVFRKTLKKFCLRKFLVRIFLDTDKYLLYRELAASELVLQRGGLSSEIALLGGGGGNVESKIFYRGQGYRCTSKLK